jgi:hypothetical protein
LSAYQSIETHTKMLQRGGVMEVPSSARIPSDYKLNADASAAAAKSTARTWTLNDDEYGCGERNSSPPPDWALLGAVVDLEN